MPTPHALVMEVEGADATVLAQLAREATEIARFLAPKLSGASSENFEPVMDVGRGRFGIAWQEDYVWYQDRGIQPFTMHALAGRTIPMWIDDPTGEERARNPNASVRTTLSGKTQVLIFRTVARHGETKQRTDPRTGATRQVPRSYPGAPGRIAVREARAPLTTPGRRGGQIARGNVGVRWRHPGLDERGFLERGLEQAALRIGFDPGPIFEDDVR